MSPSLLRGSASASARLCAALDDLWRQVHREEHGGICEDLEDHGPIHSPRKLAQRAVDLFRGGPACYVAELQHALKALSSPLSRNSLMRSRTAATTGWKNGSETLLARKYDKYSIRRGAELLHNTSSKSLTNTPVKELGRLRLSGSISSQMPSSSRPGTMPRSGISAASEHVPARSARFSRARRLQTLARYPIISSVCFAVSCRFR